MLPARSPGRLVAGLLAGLLVGCTGSVGTSPTDPADNDNPGGGSNNGGGDPDVRESEGGTCAALPTRLWRLDPVQMTASLSALFGVNVDAKTLPADPENPYTGFSNDAKNTFVSAEHAEAYFSTGRTVATAVVNKLKDEGACAVKAAPAEDCVRDFVQNWGTTSFGRDMSTEEVDRYAGFFSNVGKEHGEEVAARLVIEAMIQSPHFIYRSELGEGSGNMRFLNGFERASLISYMLTGLPPDEELRQAASDGGLDTVDGVTDHVRRLLKSDSAAETFNRFVVEHLALRDMDENQHLDDALAPQILAAEKKFVQEKVWRNGAEGTLEDLYLGAGFYADKDLATHYQLDQSPSDLQALNLDPQVRFGVLTGGFLLTQEGPILRGREIKIRLLCEDVPEPPPNAAGMGEQFFPSDSEATQSELWTKFQESAPACAACHATFQPLGLAFEVFDDLGRHRTTNHAGRTIDPASQITDADGWSGEFSGPRDMIEKIVGSEAGQACFVERYLTFSLGARPSDPETDCMVKSVVEDFKKGGRTMESLLVSAAVKAATAPRKVED